MKVEKIDLEETNAFSPFFLDYISNNKKLAPFYGQRPEIGNFQTQIDQKVFTADQRKVLHDTLRDQYSETHPVVQRNIDSLLSQNTYTVTTGHQLNIFTGPLYFIYKIVTVVNACKTLKQQYPENDFVPVYWMASEDHDFDEICYFYLFGKKYSWNSDQKGAVGRFDTSGLQDLLNELPEKAEIFEQAYTRHSNLADAVRCYINELFGAEGVVVLDADDRQFKKQFSKVIEDDLFNHHANDLVEEASSKLSGMGYGAQVFPRAINFFYLDGDIRERIVKESSNWKVLNTDLCFSEKEIQDLIVHEPEKFSPNVVMRPLLQEMILPNLAYAGGPAEVVYWMQLKSVFEYYKVPFPILMPRNFALFINKPSMKKMEKVGLSNTEIFHDTQKLIEDYMKQNGNSALGLSKEKEDLKSLFDGVAEKASEVDGSLKGFVGAELNKAMKSMENIEKRLKKADEQKHEVTLNQITGLKEKLFPNGGLQERHDNFLNFYLNQPDFIAGLLDCFDPFDFRFNILKDD
ncbi:MAG: bacillithiol biosynthesis cysteine-adding enzyme BshC [Cyclobacteriaceae bacterium]